MSANLVIVGSGSTAPKAGDPRKFDPILLERLGRTISAWLARHRVLAALCFICIGAALGEAVRRFGAPRRIQAVVIQSQARLANLAERSPCPPQTPADVTVCAARFEHYTRLSDWAQRLRRQHERQLAKRQEEHAREAGQLQARIHALERARTEDKRQNAALLARWKHYAGVE